MEKQNQSADMAAASDQMSSPERGHLKISAMRQAWERHMQCWMLPIWKKSMVQMLR